jgi:hypothetical protein
MTLRKHPDVFALLVLGFALFANFGAQRVVQAVEGERMRVRELVHVERPGKIVVPVVREGILNLKDTLRCLRP